MNIGPEQKMVVCQCVQVSMGQRDGGKCLRNKQFCKELKINIHTHTKREQHIKECEEGKIMRGA